MEESHLICDAGGRAFAIAESRVVEVTRHGESGDARLEDLSRILGGPPAEIGPRTCVVLVNAQQRGGTSEPVGLVVDAATDLVAFAEGDLVAPPDFGPHVRLTYLAALARRNGTFAIVLDLDRLLGEDAA